MAGNRPLFLAFASLIGIALIGYVSDSMTVGMIPLDKINSSMLNQVVHVRGLIEEENGFNGGIKLLITDNDYKISVIYFSDAETTAKRGMCADVIGEVKTYQSSLEIEAGELRVFIC